MHNAEIFYRIAYIEDFMNGVTHTQMSTRWNYSLRMLNWEPRHHVTAVVWSITLLLIIYYYYLLSKKGNNVYLIRLSND